MPEQYDATRSLILTCMVNLKLAVILLVTKNLFRILSKSLGSLVPLGEQLTVCI